MAVMKINYPESIGAWTDFRAQALESLLSEDGLQPDLRRLALENLIFRYDVLLTGAEKRGGSPHAEEWMTSRLVAKSALEALSCR